MDKEREERLFLLLKVLSLAKQDEFFSKVANSEESFAWEKKEKNVFEIPSKLTIYCSLR